MQLTKHDLDILTQAEKLAQEFGQGVLAMELYGLAVSLGGEMARSKTEKLNVVADPPDGELSAFGVGERIFVCPLGHWFGVEVVQVEDKMVIVRVVAPMGYGVLINQEMAMSGSVPAQRSLSVSNVATMEV